MTRKPIRHFLILTMLALTVGLVSVPVWAAETTGESSEINDTQAEQIRQNCKQAQSVLQRLQSTDVATRINRGRIYENLLNRLIAPFNSRVSANRYDASTLTGTTSAISQKFTDFKNDYISYADSFSSLLSINCESDPRGFYRLLTNTRSARERVANDIAELNTSIDRYTDTFTMLRTSIEGR